MTQRSDFLAPERRLAASASTVDTDSDTITRRARIDEGDHDKFAHYARKNDITEAMVTGKAVTAICGKKWVPTRSPDDFPVCPDCKRIYDQLKPAG